MEFQAIHSWNLAPVEAIALQKNLAKMVRLDSSGIAENYRYVASCDVSFNKGSDQLYAAIAVTDIQESKIVEEQALSGEMHFPYIPGLLSFRELPIILQGFSSLKIQPDLVICDGQGIAHPRRLGIASHLGIFLQIPTIGCAKKLLCGQHDELENYRGAASPIYHKQELIGYAVRTRENVKPVYISPGHLCDFSTAIQVILQVTSKYRLPDPIRYVHNLANAVRKAASHV